MQPRLIIAYSLMALMVMMISIITVWMRYNSQKSKDIRRRRCEDLEYREMFRRQAQGKEPQEQNSPVNEE